MRKYLFIIVLIVIVFCLSAAARQEIANLNRPLFAPDLIKIKLSAEAIQRAQLPVGLYAERSYFGINELDQLMAVNGGKSIIRAHREVNDKAWQAKTGFDRWFLIRLDGSVQVKEAIDSFKDNRYVDIAIPEYYAYTTAVPNDTYYANNWGHNNTAQLPVYSGSSHSGAGIGTIGYDADMQLAWDQSQGYGSASIIIAIIDTGVDTAHPDLRLVAGYDYGVGDSNPMDDSADPGHGTSCSGVAAAIANNGLGITGAAGGCSVMPLKIADAAGNLGFTAIENAITHAGDHNADVASMSFGAEGGMVEGNSPSTDAALEYAYSHGVTLLAATANSNTSAIAYPSNHNKVISVGASSPTGQRKSSTSSDGEYWWGSNYGTAVQDASLAVDVCAPTILPSTDITGEGNGYNTSSDYYMWFNGTSCATPYAAGVAGLILSKVPTLTPAQVRTALTSTCTDMTFDGGVGWDRYTGYGMVNANNALNSLIPGMPSCMITSPGSGTAFDVNSVIPVNVTATDSDGTITQVAFYIDDVFQFTDNSAPWTWNWNTAGYAGGSHSIKAIATDNSSNTATNTISVNLIAPAEEGFESGNFSAFAWNNSSPMPWTVQSSERFSGTYAAKSGDITHNGATTLSLPMVVSANGTISFYYKVSSEANYDSLRFYIDGALKDDWSGTAGWAAASYPVTAGTRTFSWTYTKDSSVDSGSDCAWLDHLIFPPRGVFYAPPQDFATNTSHNAVKITWTAPASGTPTGYMIYKNGVLLTTVTGLSYIDTAVTNGTSYAYYLTATYSGGISDPTTTLNATPNAVAPTNLTAVAGNAFVDLAWTATTGFTVSGYKIYRNGNPVTTLTGTTYHDTAVVNGTSYTYYVTTLYTSPNGESAASNAAQAMPTAIVPSTVILGTGTSVTTGTAACPINIYYKSLHGQSIYTRAELNAAGAVGPMNITQIGFYVATVPTLALPNWKVRMKHTSATDGTTWQTATDMITVYTAASYMPTAGGYAMLTLTTPFLWNGVDNIVIDTAFSPLADFYSTGTVQFTSVSNGYRYARSDDADQTDVFTGGLAINSRPNLKLSMVAATIGPMILANPGSIAYGDVAVNTQAVNQFTVQNFGNQTLTGTITTPAGYSVAVARNETALTSDLQISSRNVININIPAGTTVTYSLSFTPTAVQSYNGNLVITTNASNNSTVTIVLSGQGYIPPTISLDTTSMDITLLPEAEGTDSFSISNTGSQDLIYTISAVEGAAPPAPRNITGSTLTVDVLEYTPGTSQDWIFTAYNASTDSEWLEDIYITFPAGVTVNSASTFVGGSGGVLTPDFTSGTGITINWYDATGGQWGIIYGGESATATLNVTVPSNMTAPIDMAWQIDGDIYGTEPHELTGTITINAGLTPLSWFSTDIESGTILPGETEVVSGNFSAVGMAPGTYEALLTINSNDPQHPSTQVNVQMVIATPEIVVNPTSLDYGIVHIGESEVEQITIENTGTAVLSGNITSPEGFTVAAGRARQSNPQASKNSSSLSTAPDERNQISFSIPAGESRVFDLTFSPVLVQSYDNHVVITHNAPGDPVDIDVRGVGGTAYLDLSSTAFAMELPINGSTSQILSVSNPGNMVLDYSLSVPAGVGWLSLNGAQSVSSSIEAGGPAQDIVLGYNATGLAPGMYSVMLEGVSNALDCSEFSVSVDMRARGAVIGVSATEIDFGTIRLNTFATAAFDISNTGNNPLNGVITTPDGYSVVLASVTGLDSAPEAQTEPLKQVSRNALAYSIPAYTSKTFSLSFAPLMIHDYQGDLVITHNAAGPDKIIELSAWGGMPSLRFNEDGLTANLVHGLSATQSIAFTNFGNLAASFELSESAVWLSLNGAGSFSGTIPAYGDPLLLNVGFDTAGLIPGTYTASITGSSNDPNHVSISIPVTLNVIGTQPELNLPESFSFDRNGFLSLDFTDYMSDPNGDPLSIDFSGNTGVLITVDGTWVHFSNDPSFAGSESITFTVSDGTEQAQDIVTVNVVNHVPMLNAPLSMSLDQDGQLLVDFGPFISDPDLDLLVLDYSGNSNVDVEIDGFTVTLTPAPGWFGEENITFSLSDGYLQAQDVVQVIVNQVISSLDTPVISISQTATGALLDWEVVTYADLYLVYRASEPYGEYFLIGSTYATEFEDNQGWPKAFYKVKAATLPPVK